MAVLLLAACGRTDANRASGTAETLPNGAVRVANPAQGLWTDRSAWRLVPELQVGEADGAAATTFGSVSGLAVDSAGRIFVLDRQTNELRIFTPRGVPLRTVGRSGGGPGEYTSPNGLVWLSPDTLLVVDQQGGRYSILTRAGDFVRSVPRRIGGFSWLFSGGAWGGRIYELGSTGTGTDRRAVLLATSLAGGGGAGGDEPAVDTVRLPVQGPSVDGFRVEKGNSVMVVGVPFAPGAVYHLDGHGGIWHGHGSRFRLVRSTLAGDTTLEVLLDAAPTPVTPAELQAWESGPSLAQFKRMGGRVDMSRIPRTKPFFDGVTVDPDGYLWVSVPGGPTEAVFEVFDPGGRYLGRLRANGAGRDIVPPVVRNGRLYLVGSDEMDVQRVYVYRIDR
ncbi:MAG TPA: 6-bladed beta-propeller [Longimicrobium sp.]|nr:6-bladed beta-propeller [Longimicrobium sp.]